MSYTGPGRFERVTRGSTSFTTGALGLAREDTGGSVTDYRYDPDGLLLVIRSDSSATYPLYDGLGSVVATSTGGGSYSAVARYEPFGSCLENCPTGPYRWLGGLGVYLDEATQLYKMGTRYYDPALGRFTQVDPVEGGSANRYDYAAQDSINTVDPDGNAAVFGDGGGCWATCHWWRQYMVKLPKSAFRRNLIREARALARAAISRRAQNCVLTAGQSALIAVRYERVRNPWLLAGIGAIGCYEGAKHGWPRGK